MTFPVKPAVEIPSNPSLSPKDRNALSVTSFACHLSTAPFDGIPNVIQPLGETPR
ncbi:hypothetical protein [Ruegeria sp. HKCCA5463]|uniref:hypothetical protein n=1 Tax=Ruegeria sp. HKCCA5463 TaxID=2682994 RepID=UPI001C2BDF9C|nr:hypothetical protein [Ruegeria sp. HKCCA5463]